MRPRQLLLLATALSSATLGIVACLPDPTKDFEDYASRTAAFAPTVAEGGVFEAAAPPKEAVTGLYYGVCLSELSLFQLDNVLSFYTESSFVPGDNGADGKLTLKLQPLKLNDMQNPPNVAAKANVTGQLLSAETTVAAADGRFTALLGTTPVPGDANPITGRPIVINDAKLQGFFGTERFCAQLSGQLVQPIQQPLSGDRNICKFLPIKDGDATPTNLTLADFEATTCPF